MNNIGDRESLNKTSLERKALESIKTFSLLSIIAFVLDAVILVISLFYLTRLLSPLFQPTTPSASFLGLEITIIVISIIVAIMLPLSFVFLRRGYKILKGISTDFSSPYTGVNLFFISLILVVVGAIAIIPVALLHASVAAIAVGILAIVLIGAIMGPVGEILALIVGSFRLRTHFNNSTYGTAGILFIVGILVLFLSVVAAILVYVATDSQLKKELSIPRYSVKWKDWLP